MFTSTNSFGFIPLWYFLVPFFGYFLAGMFFQTFDSYHNLNTRRSGHHEPILPEEPCGPFWGPSASSLVAYMHTCRHAYVHTCKHAYMHTCVHAYMHTCIYAYWIYAFYFHSLSLAKRLDFWWQMDKQTDQPTKRNLY